MKAAIIDACVGIKFVFTETYSPNALTLLRTVPALHSPAHWLAEAATGLWSKVTVHQELAADELQARLSFLASLPVIVTQLPELIGPAAALSLHLRLTLYDTLYLALAERLEVPLVSDDRRLIAAARTQARFKDLVVWIGDFAA